MFLGSDVAAFIEFTREAVELGQDQVVEIWPDRYAITSFDGQSVDGTHFHIGWDLAAAEKGGFDYFMLKEIQEQPRAVADTLRGHLVGGQIVLDEQRVDRQDLRDVDKVFVVACGTAYHAGLIAKHAIEHWTRIPVEVEMASEFRYRDPVLDRQTLVVAISQSGETADTLGGGAACADRSARRCCPSAIRTGRRSPESPTPCSTRTPGRDRGGGDQDLYRADRCGEPGGARARAGAGHQVWRRDQPRVRGARRDAGADGADPGRRGPVRELAREIALAKAVLFLGRGVGYPVALEGALKLKELAYMHAEGFPAGELKHGPIALIEDGLPVVIVMPSPTGRRELHRKMLSNIAEIRAAARARSSSPSQVMRPLARMRPI